MKIFIALGGIGCNLLDNFQEINKINNDYCYYLDTVSDDLYRMEKKGRNVFKFGSVSSGAGANRSIGKNLIKYDIYSNKLNSFFNNLSAFDEVEIVLITSSFGGTGSGAVFYIAEYVQALLWDEKNNRCKECKVVAFSYKSFLYMEMFPEVFKRISETNTINMVMKGLKYRTNSGISNKSMMFEERYFNPNLDFYLINTPVNYEDINDILLMDSDKLDGIDQKDKYIIKNKSFSPLVFISYSSQDQKIADLFADILEEKEINYWISSRSINSGSYAKQIIQGINGCQVFVVLLSKNSISSEHVKNEIDRAFSRLSEGIKIIPFIIDECELDDECQYYLCRQEMFDGTNPPMYNRILEIVKQIKKYIE